MATLLRDGVRHACLILLASAVCGIPAARATVYFASSSDGNDANDGLARDRAFRSIARVNQLTLVPGDEVRLRCGDTWSAETLVIKSSGSPGSGSEAHDASGSGTSGSGGSFVEVLSGLAEGDTVLVR